jgi:hypothetical protein
MIPDFEAVIDALDAQKVEYVVVGAVALVLHGSPRVTRDLDICYSRDPSNLRRLARAFQPFAPTLRGAPAGLPFRLDEATLQSGLNFTLSTAVGDVDLLGEVSGIGGYPVVKRLSGPMTVYRRTIQVLGLDGLERAKRAAGRITDVADLAEILELKKRRSG